MLFLCISSTFQPKRTNLSFASISDQKIKRIVEFEYPVKLSVHSDTFFRSGIKKPSQQKGMGGSWPGFRVKSHLVECDSKRVSLLF